MAHYAYVDETDTVTTVIVAEQAFIDSGAVGDPSRWIQTSYNTWRGQHYQGGTALRKNYAGIGYTYDRTRDAFIQPKPKGTYVINEDTCHWVRPLPYPATGGNYEWSDESQAWIPSTDPMRIGK